MDRFNYDFYNNFYPDLKEQNWDSETLRYHFENYGINEGRIGCEEDFYTAYPNFNYKFYNNFYYDIKEQGWNKYQVMWHYCIFGISEGRMVNEKDFYSANPNFDVEFYSNFYEDIKSLNYNRYQIMGHYYTHGINEGRIICEKYFLEINPNFDFEYNNEFFQEDINSEIYSKYQIMRHYNKQTYILDIIDIISYNFTNLFSHVNIEFNNVLVGYDNYLHNKQRCTDFENSYYNKLFLFWIKKCTEEKCISIVSPFDNTIIKTDKYFILTETWKIDIPYLICNYYFEKENIILGLGLGTGCGQLETRILYIYNFKKNVIYYSWYDYNKNDFKKNIFLKIIKLLPSLNKYNFDNIIPKIKTIYGYNNNMGHMLFNDYTGLFLLKELNILNCIDEAYFGKNDVYMIKKYLKKNYNMKIIDNIKDLHLLNNVFDKGVLFKFNHFHISNLCIKFLKNNLINSIDNDIKLNSLNLVKQKSNDIKNNHYPIFNIVLRKGSHEMIDQEIVISELINKITDKYPNSFIYFDGFCKSEEINDDDVFGFIGDQYKYSDLVLKYSNLVDNIVSRINTKNYLSLINYNIIDLLTHIFNCNYGIYNLGSAACNSGWICNTPGIQFGRSNIKIYEIMDKFIREDMPNINYLTDNIIFYENSFKISSETIFDLIPNF
jgi:hypothetical protein